LLTTFRNQQNTISWLQYSSKAGPLNRNTPTRKPLTLKNSTITDMVYLALLIIVAHKIPYSNKYT
jgi:hypothetical protein